VEGAGDWYHPCGYEVGWFSRHLAFWEMYAELGIGTLPGNILFVGWRGVDRPLCSKSIVDSRPG
jgi:hypothetical protein